MSPLAVLASSLARTSSSLRSPDALFAETAPSSPWTSRSVEPPAISRSEPGGHVIRTSKSPPQLIWIGPQRILSRCSIVMTCRPWRSSARTTTSSCASTPLPRLETSSTLVCGSSAVETRTRPLGSRTERHPRACRKSASPSPGPVPRWRFGAADAAASRALLALRTRSLGSRNGVVEGERGKIHRVLLSALGVALDAVASAARVRLRARVERVRDGTHEPCVGRDASCAAAASMPILSDSGRRSEMRPLSSSPAAA